MLPGTPKPSQVITAPREGHSRKPAVFQHSIDAYFRPDAPRLELFARPPLFESSAGASWWILDNEVPGFPDILGAEEQQVAWL